MTLRTAAILACTLALSTAALAPRTDPAARSGGSENGGVRRAATSPTTAPTTQPLVSQIVGRYLGTVVDDDDTVPCLTTFRDYHGRVAGEYIVRFGTKDAYNGTLDGYTLVDEARRECRFRWHDKNGEGLVTIQLSPDGGSFSGSWGLEVVQEKLVWTGKREAAPATRRSSHGSN